MLDLEHYLLIGFISIALIILGSAFYLKRTKASRTLAKGNTTAILDHYNVLQTINEDQKITISSQRQKVAMLQKKVNELEGYEEEDKAPELNITQLKPIATALGINDQQLEGILNDPKAKKWLNKGENMQLLQIALPFIQSRLTQNQSNPLDQGAVSQGQVGA